MCKIFTLIQSRSALSTGVKSYPNLSIKRNNPSIQLLSRQLIQSGIHLLLINSPKILSQHLSLDHQVQEKVFNLEELIMLL
jgi:hypothetical protein